MKKHGISKRILAMMLVLCMVFTMLPANAKADETTETIEKGSVKPGDMGLKEDSIDYDDHIIWPIEIYDYENDGMLFEYAGATGDGDVRDELDKKGEYCFIPDMKTTYYADYTNPVIDYSYVVTNWITKPSPEGWGLDPDETTNTITNGMRYYTFDESFDKKDSGGTELIDFRDRNSDAVENSYNAGVLEDGSYVFGNAYGYQFTISAINTDSNEATIANESVVIATSADAYSNSNPNWAVSIHLRPKTGTENEYSVVQAPIINPVEFTTNVENKNVVTAKEAGILWEDGDIVMVVHSASSNPTAGKVNWKSNVAAIAIAEEDTITLSSDPIADTTPITATVNIPAGEANPNATVTVPAKNVQYAVLVYKTTNLEEAGKVEAVLRDEDGTKKYWGTDVDVDTSATTSDWTYKVLGFAEGYTTLGADGEEDTTRKTDWANINPKVQSAGIRFTTDDEDYEFMISHFAMFATEGEAKAYGEKALVYNKHYIHKIYPEAEYSADYTTSEIDNSKLETYWFTQAYGMVEKPRDVNSITNYKNAYSVGWDVPSTVQARSKYYTFSNLNSDILELIDFSNIGGIEKNKANYAVLVFRLYDTSIENIQFQAYLREKSVDKTYGDSKLGVLSENVYAGEGKFDNWKTVVLDLSDIQWEDAERVYSAGIKMNGMSSTKFEIDITQFALFEDKNSAETYAEDAKNYIKYTETPTTYYNPIYSNLGYGFLVGSHDNPNNEIDKYDDRIGYTFIPENIYDTSGNVTGTQFENAHSTLDDMIYFLEAGKGSSTDLSGDVDDFAYDGNKMETLPFDGYTLFGELTEGSMTAGLLEGTLGEDGNPVYREQVIDYLAKLMETTLVIPEYKNGRFNYDFVRGAESLRYGSNDIIIRDLASAIRECVGIDFDKSDTVVNDEVELKIGDGKRQTFKVNAPVTVKEGTNTITRYIKTSEETTVEITAKIELDQTKYKAGVLAAMVNGQSEDMGKNLKGEWKYCQEYVDTCHDAAYYLLSNLFVSGSYNDSKSDYDYLVLNKAELSETGKDLYVFDAGFSTTDPTSSSGYKSVITYEKGMINYAGATNKAQYYFADNTPTTLFPFLPVTDGNTSKDMTKSPYFADDGVSYDGLYGGTYYERDFNYVMKSSGQFVYYEEDELYFEFEGDDDVYLFINGELVLDIGGAHSITKEKININDYVKAAQAGLAGDKARNDALNLEDGEICTFDFFYMERHGYGANCRIATNMRVTDPSLIVDKTAKQDGEKISYGGSVTTDSPVEYIFNLTNNGNVKLYNLIFEDKNIGVRLDYEKGLTVAPGSKVKDANGEVLTESDLVAKVNGFKKVENGEGTHKLTDAGIVPITEGETGNYVTTEEIEVRFEDEQGKTAKQKLKEFMKTLAGKGLGSDPNAEGENEGSGLWAYSSVTIEGIYYPLTDEKVFDNVLEVTADAVIMEGETKTLHSQDNHRVYVNNELVYYQWANHEIKINQNDFMNDLANSVGNISLDEIKNIELYNANEGTPVSIEGTWNSDWKMCIDYTTPGENQFNVKVSKTDGNEQDTDGDGLATVYGYTFNVDNVTEVNESSKIVRSDVEYENSNPKWAVSVHLRLTEKENVYEVVQAPIENPIKNDDGDGKITIEEAGIHLNSGDIVLLVHSEQSGKENWKDKVAALALSVGDTVTLSVDGNDEGTVIVDKDQIVPITVIATEVTNSAYVLDYGLSVDLLEGNELFKKDIVSVANRKLKTNVLALGVDDPTTDDDFGYEPNNIIFTPTYKEESILNEFEVPGTEGVFYLHKDLQTLTYTPTELMDKEDSVYVAVSVHEANKTAVVLGEVDIKKEAQMYKEIKVLPANVVYYEDDFPGIKYKDENENSFVSVEDFEHKRTSNGVMQSADQNQIYGQDEVYKNNSNMSGESITEITIRESKKVAYFDFKGTGFELISQTNAVDSAKFSVKVVKEVESTDAEGNPIVKEETVRNIPIITEFDNNDNGDGGTEAIYQVPVIRVDDLELGNYRVYISGIPTRDYTKNPDGTYKNPDKNGKPAIVPTILYIDGLRIFQPLGETNGNYIDKENGAIFEEIRDLIVNGQAAIAEYTQDTLIVSTGTATWTENHNGTSTDGKPFDGNKVASANDYLVFGPNNEVYMAYEKTTDTDADTDTPSASTSALVFYVKDNDSAVHNLQIAFRAIDEGLFNGTAKGTSAKISYGIYDVNDQEEPYKWTEAIITTSGTEQYYEIDYAHCPKDKNGRYQIAIRVDEGMISYTSLKYNGLTIEKMNGETEGEVPSLIYKDGVLIEKSSGEPVDEIIHPAFNDLKLQFIAKDTIGFDEIGEITGEDDGDEESDDKMPSEPLRYQIRENRDVRLIAYVDELTKYSEVSFTLTINGKDSKDLKCTTAYSGLYANGTLWTTDKIFGEDKKGYFVTFTINNYLNVYRGQEVIITATYKLADGTEKVETRTVTIGEPVEAAE